MPNWIKQGPEDYETTVWSGGTTTQLAIAPSGARYARRDFLWRVSSATVETEESDFTPLPDYERLIATLRGEIRLRHNDGPPILLRPLEVHRFSGADQTRSRGRCRDFNLMLRRGRADGSMEALMLSGETASGLYPLQSLKTMSKIAERAEQLISDPALLSRMSDAAYETCKTKYDVGIVNRQMREFVGY